MKNLALMLFSAAIGGFVLAGCSQEARPAGDPKETVYENIKAMESEDLDKAMATIDDASESYDQTKLLARRLFEVYDLRYELDSVRVVSKTDDDAQVECIQTTRKVAGPAFRDNRIVILHMLRNCDGKWKIYASKTKKIDYLD